MTEKSESVTHIEAAPAPDAVEAPPSDAAASPDQTNISSPEAGGAVPKRPRTRKSSAKSKMAADLAPSEEDVAAQPSLQSEEDVPPQGHKKTNAKEVLIVEEVQNQKANRELRKTYADKAYEIVSCSLQFLFTLVAFNAIWVAISGKQVISDQLLFALITGVTVNVLAAFLGVIRGIFPTNSGKKAKKRRRK